MSALSQPTPAPRLLSLDETCAILGIRRDLLFTDVLPTIRTVRIGRRRLVHPDDLAAWIDARRASGGD